MNAYGLDWNWNGPKEGNTPHSAMSLHGACYERLHGTGRTQKAWAEPTEKAPTHPSFSQELFGYETRSGQHKVRVTHDLLY